MRAAVGRWAATRPHLERPSVVHYVAPTERFWARLRRWATVSVLDPTSDAQSALSFVNDPWAWPDGPRLTVTSEPDAMEA